MEGKAALANERGLCNLNEAVEDYLEHRRTLAPQEPATRASFATAGVPRSRLVPFAAPGRCLPPETSGKEAGEAATRGECHFHRGLTDLGRFAGALRWEAGALAGLEAGQAGGEAGAAAESGGTPSADLLEGFLDNENIISWNQLLLGRGGATAADGSDGAFAGLWNAVLALNICLGQIVIGNEDLC